MNILSISSDRKVFEQGSAVRSRLLEYGRLVDEIHVIVLSKKSSRFHQESFRPNIFLYPTNARTKSGYILCALKQAVKLKKHGVHIDVVTAQDPFELGLIAFFVARILGAKLHLQVHTDFMSSFFTQESFVNHVRVRIAKMLLPRADAVRVVSERIKNSLVSVHIAHMRVLPIFTDTAHNAKISPHHDLKKKYPQFEKHILMTSRLSREKNVELALDVMKDIIVKHPKIGLIIVGSGPEEQSLKKYAAKNNLQHNVIFEGWQDELFSYYKTANLFVSTSNYEGYGMTIVEALSAGCPVVMTDVGCAGEVVHHGKNGLIVPVGDKGVLERTVLHVVTGGVALVPSLPKLFTKEEYLTSYRASWEDALI